jgi:outer membrane protein TolC
MDCLMKSFYRSFLCAGVGLTLLAGGQALDTEKKTPEATPQPGYIVVSSMTLLNCLESAVQGNPDIRQASAGFQNAEGQAVGLRAILYPTLKTQAISTPPTINVQLEQVLYDRAIAPQLELARLSQEGAVIRYQASLNRVFFQIRQVFALALARQSSVVLLEDYLGYYTKARRSAAGLYEAGKLKKVALSRLDVKINLAREQLETARSSYRQNLLELSRLLGRDLPEITRLAGKLGEDDIPELDAEKLIQEALLKRQDYQYLKLKKREETQQVLLATESLYPRLALGSNATFQLASLGGAADYNFGRNDNEPGAQRQEGNTQIPLGVQLTWNFFDGNRSQGIKQSAQARLVNQEEALSALERAIPGEVVRTVTMLQAARSNLETLITAPRPDQLREVAELDFNAGRLRLLDKALVEDAILDQEQKILEQRLTFSLSAAALDFSLGNAVQYSLK